MTTTKALLNGPVQPSNRYGWGMDTKAHARLEASADKLLRACGFFTEGEQKAINEYFEDLFGEAEYLPLEAEACGVHGLRPTWHGRA